MPREVIGPWFDTPPSGEIELADRYKFGASHFCVGGDLWNYAADSPEEQVGVAAGFPVRRLGRAYHPTATATDRVAAVPPDSTNFSIVVVIEPSSSATGQTILAADDAAAANRIFSLQVHGSTLLCNRWNTAGTVSQANTFSACEVGRAMSIVVIADGTSTKVFTRQFLSSATMTGTPHVWGANRAAISNWHSRVSGGVWSLKGQSYLHLGYITSRVLSGSEARLLTISPEAPFAALLAPRHIEMPAALAGPAGPTVTALTPTTIGSTSHRPRYTWTP